MKNLLLKLTILIAFVLNVVVVKAQPSSFSLLSPINGNYVNTLPYFDWANSSNATSYQLYVDGALKKDYILNSNYQLQIGEELTPGMHTWYVIAVGAGSTQSNEVWSFLVDAAEPSAFDLITPADNSWTTSLQPKLTWNASIDANSGLLKYQLWVDGNLIKDNISVDSTSTYPIEFLSNGAHTWLIKAVDNVGNIKNSTEERIINVDNIPPGPVDNCVYFDGSDGYAKTVNKLDIGKIVTMECWIKPYFTTSPRRAIMKIYGDYLFLAPNNRVGFRYYAKGYNWWTLYTDTYLNSNTWYHIAASHNSNTGILKIYINGILIKSFEGVFSLASQDYAYIGYGSPYGGELKFSGYIDEVRLWNYERTSTEIISTMNKVLDATCINGLVANWRFNEPLGTYEINDETNNYHNNLNLIDGGFITKSDKLDDALGGLSELIHPECSKYLSTTPIQFIWRLSQDVGIFFPYLQDNGIGLQKYQLFIDDILVKDNITDTFCIIEMPLSYGMHSWYIKGFDKLGNNQSTFSRYFYVDNSAPYNFDLISPVDSQIVNLPTPNFTWQATIDSIDGCGLSKYQLWINGKINRDSIPIHQTTVAPSNVLAQGKYTWFIRAYDKLGNMRQSTQDFTFFVDWETPTAFNLIEPNNNEVITSSKPTFKWSPSYDIGSGLNRYELHISGENVITLLPTDTTIKLPFDLSNGAYTWFVKAYDLAGGFTSSNTHALTIDVPLPGQAAKPIGVNEICINETNTEYITIGANKATSYIWEISPSEAGTITGNGLTATVYWSNTYTGIAEVKVKGQNNGGIGEFSEPIIISIHPSTVAGILQGSASICEGQSTGTLLLEGNIGDIIKWQKRLNQGNWEDVTDTNSIYNEIPLISGIWDYRVEVKSGVCSSEFSTSASINVGDIPLSAGTISGLTTVCQGESAVIYTVPAIANATSYVWTLPNGATGSSTTRSITVNYGTAATSGNITVKGKNACGEGTVSTLAITVNALPSDAGIISGATTVCQGESSVTYTVPAITNATSYVWTLPNGATGTSTTRSITVNYGTSATSGNITVKGKNTCGEGAGFDLYITVNSIPDKPIISFDGFVLHSDALMGNQWYNSGGLIEDATEQQYTVTTQSTYYVIVSILGCSSEKSNEIDVIGTNAELKTNGFKVTVFPNPTQDELTIVLKGSQELMNLKVLNSLGITVVTDQIVEESTINLSCFAPGIYYVKIYNNKVSEYIKIIKQ